MNSTQKLILRLLTANSAMTSRELGLELGITHHAVNASIKAMREAGIHIYIKSWNMTGGRSSPMWILERTQFALHAAEPAPNTLGFAQGLEAAAKMLDAKADDYAKDFGFDDTGGLEFSREAQREYHSTLIELAEEVRSIKASEPAPLVRLTQIERDRIATSCQSTQQVISATIDAMVAKNGGQHVSD